ncbi:MAG: filamentous hemagglutinin N-terminal domain-containing protein [Candidatus Riflebacteria bacterium]|nr:filamentous hemagglutinin N-terminal domain-containing protein [Candidatus Riflebacteria bacterium]
MRATTHRRYLRIVAVWVLICHTGGMVPLARANPTGGVVVAGSATIDQTNPAITTIQQGTDRAIINWQSFGNQANEAIRFAQPSDLAVTLNRVTGVDPSVLAGSLSANGHVFLVNPNGILFGPTARVDVGALTASTLSIGDDDFMNGRIALTQDTTRQPASIVNQGRITAKDRGMVTLVAPLVSNEGKIVANLGQVTLAAGKRAVVNLDGQGLINVALDDGERGDVMLSPDAAGDVVRQVVNHPKIVEAGAVEERDGKVFLKGAEGVAINSGEIEARGASDADGGRVTIDSTQTTVLAPGSSVSASGQGQSSDGGTIMALSRGRTIFAPRAKLESCGGETGDGGFIEVSGKDAVTVDGQVDTTAPAGKTGTFYIDPLWLTIINGGPGTGDQDVNLPDIFFADANTALNTVSEVSLQNLGAGTNIILEAIGTLTLNNLADNNLTLSLNSNITLRTQNGAITFQDTADAIVGSGTGTITITAGSNLGAVAPITIGSLTTATGGIDVTAGSGDGAIAPISVQTLTTAGGAISLTSGSGTGASGGITTNGVLTSTGGAITMTSGSGAGASGGITTVGDVNSAGGAIQLSSGTGAGATGAITTGNMTSGNANITLTAGTSGGNVAIGTLNAGTGNVAITAPQGSIGKNNAAGVNNITGTTANLVAGQTIGAAALPLETALATLNARTNAGSIIVTEADSITLGVVVAAGGGSDVVVTNVGVGDLTLGSVTADDQITLTSTQDILDGNLVSPNLTCGTATLSAARNIGALADPVETAIATLVASTANGSIFVNEVDAITLRAITAAGAGNDLSVTAAGSITVGGGLSAVDQLTLTSTAGAIIDGNAGNDITAVGLTLNAGTSIANSADPLDTTVDNLSATATSGGIFILESNTLLSTVATAAGAGADVAITCAAGDMAVGAVTAGNQISLSATGASLTDGNAGANNLTAPTATLFANTNIGLGDALETRVDTLTAGVATGAIEISEFDSITLSAINAGTDAVITSNGAMTASAVTVGNNATLTAVTGDLRVGAFSVGNQVSLTAQTGSILDDNGAGNNITAPTISLLQAGGSIGTALDPLDTTITTLTSAVTGNGGIHLAEANGLILTAATAAGAGSDVVVSSTTGDIAVWAIVAPNQITLTATAGAITDANAGVNNLTALSANLTAGTNVAAADPLETTLGTLNASAAAGGIGITETDTITLGTISAVGAASDVAITSGGAMTVGAVNAGNNATLTASTGDMRVGTVTAANQISLTASTGSILDNNGAALNLTCPTLNLVATAGGIAAAGDPIETSVTTLATITGGAGHDRRNRERGPRRHAHGERQHARGRGHGGQPDLAHRDRRSDRGQQRGPEPDGRHGEPVGRHLHRGQRRVRRPRDHRGHPERHGERRQHRHHRDRRPHGGNRDRHRGGKRRLDLQHGRSQQHPDRVGLRRGPGHPDRHRRPDRQQRRRHQHHGPGGEPERGHHHRGRQRPGARRHEPRRQHHQRRHHPGRGERADPGHDRGRHRGQRGHHHHGRRHGDRVRDHHR